MFADLSGFTALSGNSPAIGLAILSL